MLVKHTYHRGRIYVMLADLVRLRDPLSSCMS
jgi:hypothetical protein